MPEETWWCEDVMTIQDLLTGPECDHLIEHAENLGFEEATVSTPEGDKLVSRYRNNDRVMVMDNSIADDLWDRVQDFVPRELEGRTAIGINELIRFYRYDPGQQFQWHSDVGYERDNGEMSMLTLLVYLNDVASGGQTAFDDTGSIESFEPFEIIPNKGMATLFLHEVYHSGEPVLEGRKYVLRTDVMYSALEERDFEEQNE